MKPQTATRESEHGLVTNDRWMIMMCILTFPQLARAEEAKRDSCSSADHRGLFSGICGSLGTGPNSMWARLAVQYGGPNVDLHAKHSDIPAAALAAIWIISARRNKRRRVGRAGPAQGFQDAGPHVAAPARQSYPSTACTVSRQPVCISCCAHLGQACERQSREPPEEPSRWRYHVLGTLLARRERATGSDPPNKLKQGHRIAVVPYRATRSPGNERRALRLDPQPTGGSQTHE
jgi:hypothetical protein